MPDDDLQGDIWLVVTVFALLRGFTQEGKNGGGPIFLLSWQRSCFFTMPGPGVSFIPLSWSYCDLEQNAPFSETF